MTADELLLELRDIAPPPEPPWYLLAPVEWLGLALGLSLLVWIGYRRGQKRARRHIAAAGAELDAIRSRHAARADPPALVRDLADWLKRVVLQAYPRREVAALSGESWLAFLDAAAGDSSFSRGAGRVFGAAQYRSRVDFDVDETFALCERWLDAVAPRLRARGQDRC